MFHSKKTVKWVVIGLVIVLLTGLVSWQLASQDDKHKVSFFSWLNYPLEEYQLVSKIEKANQAQIDKVLAAYMGQSFWDLPLAAIQSELMRLDWIASAQVSRNWPNLLMVAVTEQKAVARWGENGLVNQSGEVFYPTSLQGYQDLVVLDGALGSAVKVTQRFSSIAPKFSKHNLWLESMVLLDYPVWELQIYKGPLIRFSDKHWREQLERFLLAYPQLAPSMINSAAYYDLRYSNGFVMKQKTPDSDPLSTEQTRGGTRQDDNNHREG